MQLLNINFMKDTDVKKTFADLVKIKAYVDFMPKTDIEKGLSKFFDWYSDYYK